MTLFFFHQIPARSEFVQLHNVWPGEELVFFCNTGILTRVMDLDYTCEPGVHQADTKHIHGALFWGLWILYYPVELTTLPLHRKYTQSKHALWAYSNTVHLKMVAEQKVFDLWTDCKQSVHVHVFNFSLMNCTKCSFLFNSHWDEKVVTSTNPHFVSAKPV